MGTGVQEWQFDGLVGPTHNYAGLSFGNIASEKNAGSVSNPRAAALQGIDKMRFVRGLGLPQAFFPPQRRPIISLLQQLGFGAGHSAAAIANTLENAYKNAPHLLASCYSSSFMWAANAATVSPSSDTKDGRLHFTPANLISHLHRSAEAMTTWHTLKTIFHNEALFAVHKPLPAAARLADEGAANHMRACASHGSEGIHLFVYGTEENAVKKPQAFPARQHREAGEAISRAHGLASERILHIQQCPDAIDRGVFHNDVIAMNTSRLMIAHEKAFLHRDQVVSQLERMEIPDFTYLEIREEDLSVQEAVRSYLFNSQLLELPDGGFAILAPGECETSAAANMVLRRLVEGNPVVSTVHYLNVRESMRNGGGPACLRLRVVMTEAESHAMHPGVILTEAKAHALIQWVTTHYRDRLALADLRDPAFLPELETAYAALATLLEMPDLYAI